MVNKINDPSSPTPDQPPENQPEAETGVRCSEWLGDPIELSKAAGRSASLAVKELVAALTHHVADFAARPKDSEDGQRPKRKEQKGQTTPNPLTQPEA
jgi:hypothetical protein